jgi:Phosphotransferase enzyme family
MNVVFGSVAQMLSPAGLSGLMGAAIHSVECTPMEVVHFSGNTLERVQGTCDGRPVTFVLKHFSRERDWVMRLTNDQQVREVALYRTGVYAELPGEVWQPTIAVAREGDSWAALMEEVSEWLTTPETLTEAILDSHLQHLASIHAQFMGRASLTDAEIGLSSLRDFLTILSPRTVWQELAEGRSAPVLKLATDGWQAFAKLATPQVVSLVQRVQKDIEPLLGLLQSMTPTLLHGDYKLANLGFQPGLPEARTIALDWQDASYGPGLLDLSYWLAVNPVVFPGAKKDAAIARYREALAGKGLSFSEAEWAHDLAVCLLAGGGLRLFWQMALRAQSENATVRDVAKQDLEWWCNQVSAAESWLA